MAARNLSSFRFESAIIIHRLRSYRPFDPHSEAPKSARRRRHARPLFVVPRLLIPEPPDDDTESAPDYLAGR
jgi:hypothetical protein